MVDQHPPGEAGKSPGTPHPPSHHGTPQQSTTSHAPTHPHPHKAPAIPGYAKPIERANPSATSTSGGARTVRRPPVTPTKKTTPQPSKAKKLPTTHKSPDAPDASGGDANDAAEKGGANTPSDTDHTATTAGLMDVVGKLKNFASDTAGGSDTRRGSQGPSLYRKKSKYSTLYGQDQDLEQDHEKKIENTITSDEARRVRDTLSRRKVRAEICTYHLLLIVALLRIFTTLLMVYEYEEYSIVLEYLLRLRKVNCIEVYTWVLIDLWPFILILYFFACCVLPTLTSKDVTQACIYWMVIQMVYTGYRFFFLQQYIFHREIFITKASLLMFMGHTVLDVICFTIVMIRYYFWANPCLERDRYSNTMLGGYLVNEYILFMVQSSFIRKKTAVQRATAFQIMTVVRKIKDKLRATGDTSAPSDQAIQKEVKTAIHALQDWKKFPALRIIHFFEVKEKIMKEKLRFRRQRIREMKNKFNELVHKHKKDKPKPVFKGKGKGAQTGLAPQKRALDMADVVALHLRKIKKVRDRDQQNKAYAAKRQDLLKKH